MTVKDWGSGIPVDAMADTGESALTVVMTKLHAGGKFGGDGYKVSGGLHGVGISVVNALSERLVAEVRRDGKLYRQEYARGVPVTDVEVVGIGERHRHDDLLPAGRRDLRGARSLDADARPAAAGDRLPDARSADHAHRRARGRGSSRVLRRGRDAGTSSPTSTTPRIRSTSTSSSSRARTTTARSRSRCSGTPPTSSPSSRSRTTSTPTRAAPISPASAPRSPARSTGMRATRACSRRRRTTSRARTSARGSPR